MSELSPRASALLEAARKAPRAPSREAVERMERAVLLASGVTAAAAGTGAAKTASAWALSAGGKGVLSAVALTIAGATVTATLIAKNSSVSVVPAGTRSTSKTLEPGAPPVVPPREASPSVLPIETQAARGAAPRETIPSALPIEAEAARGAAPIETNPPASPIETAARGAAPRETNPSASPLDTEAVPVIAAREGSQPGVPQEVSGVTRRAATGLVAPREAGVTRGAETRPPTAPVEAGRVVAAGEGSQSGARLGEATPGTARDGIQPSAVATGGSEPPSSASLGSEVALLQSAKAKVDAGDWAAARALLDRHQADFPSGALRLEADVLRVLAWCGDGHLAEASELAARVRSGAPRAPATARLGGSCVDQ